MDAKKKMFLNIVLSEKRPSLKGVSCQQCGRLLPPVIMHGVGKILENYEPARHFLGKCRTCGAWHRFDENTHQWVADERATELGATTFVGKQNIH